MRKLLIISLILLWALNLQADNSIRTKELIDEGNKILQERQQVVQYLENINKRVIEIQAIIKELQEQDKPAKETIE